MYDVAIIGAGIVGVSVAFLLSKHDLNVLLIDREDDVAKGTTRANSAIIHAGYDPEPDTLMAKSNLRGSKLWEKFADELNLEYQQIGSLVVAGDESDMDIVRELYRRGVENGVERLHVISKEELLKLEPRLNQTVRGALLAETAAIVNPWESCIAFAEYAARNGVEFLLNSPVTGIVKTSSGYRIAAGNRTVDTKYIVNAAGAHAPDVHALAGGKGFSGYTVRGEYFVLDRKEGHYVNHVIFPTPSKVGKGVVIAPTVHGNLEIGPTAIENADADDTATTADGQALVKKLSALLSEDIPFRENIRNFAGNRAYLEGREDFLVAESDHLPGFVNMAGIKSPGLSAAPALAEEALDILRRCGLTAKEKLPLVPYRFPTRFVNMTEAAQRELIEKDPRYGRVICRCETVTEGEIVAALGGSFTPPTISAVKRRCNAGLGRCQGGFCSVRVHEIIARERNLRWEDVTMDGHKSYIVTGETKGGDCCEDEN